MKAVCGRHLIIDAYVEDAVVLAPDTLVDLFDTLVAELGMEYLQRPTALRVPLDPNKVGTEEDDGGWSVICQITTSHIALHAWPLRKAFMMDIFSCREFDAKRAQRIVFETLGVTESSVHTIERRDPRRPGQLAA